MHKFLLGGIAALALGAATPASAGVFQLTFDPADSFSGTPATGNITATFTDTGINQVTLDIHSNLGPGETVGHEGFYFNTNPLSLATALTFTQTQGTTLTVSESNPQSFKPDGDGNMSIELSDGNNFFAAGSADIIFTITGTGVTAESFDQLSDCSSGCGTGAHYAAVHLQNTPNGGSGSDWDGAAITTQFSVPEPASLAILGVGLFGLGLVRRRIA